MGTAQQSEALDARSSSTSVRRTVRPKIFNVAYTAAEMGRSAGWAPGAEPGLDVSNPAPPYSQADASGTGAFNPSRLHQPCEITCVDYGEDNLKMAYLDNENLEEYLKRPKPENAQVRWLNINGLSWDVIRTVGKYKKLHRLAIEDLMNTRSRTKADWYSDHAFIALPLQKLVRIDHDGDEADNENVHMDNVESLPGEVQQQGGDQTTRYLSEQHRRTYENKQRRRQRGAVRLLLQDFFVSSKRDTESLGVANSFKTFSKDRSPWIPRHVRSLQRWHAGPNLERTAYMERYSALSRKGLGVSMEQVSIFLCADGTVISFFEYSAQDVERPLLRRLNIGDTILRQSADASMLLQSILDAIVDLAIPVTTAYQDALGDLELQVLTDPDISESKMIYILNSEIATLRNTIGPVGQLMGTLKAHRSDMSLTSSQALSDDPSAASIASGGMGSPASLVPAAPTRPIATLLPQRSFHVPSTVTISARTCIYLGDVEDHALLISDTYDQMRRNADNLVDLIFNTVSAYQNESMKQLTLVTCFFLPLGTLSGYFGMNFTQFKAIQGRSEAYFWQIATPVCVVVAILLLRDKFARFFTQTASKALITRSRRRRLQGNNHG